MKRFVAVQVSPTDSEDDAAVQSFVNHYRTAETYCAYELVHRSLNASSVLPAVFPTTLFAAACFLLSRHLQVSTEVDTTPHSFLRSIVECEGLDAHFKYSAETQILEHQLHNDL